MRRHDARLFAGHFTCIPRYGLQLRHVANDVKTRPVLAPIRLPIEDFFELVGFERSDEAHVKNVGLFGPGQLFAETANARSAGETKYSLGRARHYAVNPTTD